MRIAREESGCNLNLNTLKRRVIMIKIERIYKLLLVKIN